MPKKREKAEKEKPKKLGKEDLVVKLLLENSVSLQKTFLALSEKFDSLSNNILDLLKLFEITARSIAEKPELGFEKEFIDRLNNLLEQNKLIARGISLISQQLAASPAPAPSMPMPAYPPRPMPRPAAAMPAQQAMPEAQAGMPGPSEEYTQSGYPAAPGERKPRPLPQI